MSETSNDRTEQRRKLLKKAAAVPAIFVLPSTGRAVSSSSLHACVERGLQANGSNPIPYIIPKDQNDDWVREYQPAVNNGGGPDDVIEGNVLVYENTGTAPRPVAHASCWNSINSGVPYANPDTNLIS
ncbi:hypothetical protein [Accumulibacter sp.]|uniref:hypothetical protein n=1 Tax=Accumulibacter sp. TaxID=2053492 RepID=UPI0025D951AB|nr:hypothetical protein [Accumulibacter sp.]MCM8611837.1 hypothetical protein [Accumulibacter sp.]MCM8635459.1 hypothetical protein [Accumulibacter sp.]MCM8639037.1 hypothetical protein [Accumulibacter sp.]